MSTHTPAVGMLAETLRAARTARRLSIIQLATLAEVSPRLISELERGMRAHVSFETAMRLLQLVDVSIAFDLQLHSLNATATQTRAEGRRRTWTGEKTTLARAAPPTPALAAAERLTAVARASLLASALHTAYHTAAARRASKRAT